MDFGITGRRAIVCGSSAGLGFACAEALAREGVAITLVARDPVRLADAASRIAELGVVTKAVAADLSQAAGRVAAFAACPDPDILVTNAGGPPPMDFKDITLDDWARALNANFLASVEMIRLTIDGMTGRSWGRIVNITSVTARLPVQGMDLSTASRLALTGYVSGVSRQVAAHGVTINNLLPGTILTERLRKVGGVGDQLVSRVPMGRAGKPAEFGATCAFLCSMHAAYMTGQNIVVDGGLAAVTI